jgi:hypothetical protein
MGAIVDNPITSSFSGRLSEDVVFRQIGNKAFFARKGVLLLSILSTLYANFACGCLFNVMIFIRGLDRQVSWFCNVPYFFYKMSCFPE